MAVSRAELYVECFYEKKMTLVDIARLYGVSKVTVREAIFKHDPEAYRKEKLNRSIERKKARRMRELEKRREARRKNSSKKKRKQEYIQEEKEAYEWLQWRHSRIFPFKKKRGMSDADLVWFCCAQSGLKNVLDDGGATKDIKNAIKSACRPAYVPSVEYIDEHLNSIGCSKTGKSGGKSSRTARMSLMN